MFKVKGLWVLQLSIANRQEREFVIPENPPWLNQKPTFNFELTQHKKSETNPVLIQQHFAEIRSVTSENSSIYTDGSKDGDRVASAAVFGQQVYSALQ
jgi:hypothetical protein